MTKLAYYKTYRRISTTNFYQNSFKQNCGCPSLEFLGEISDNHFFRLAIIENIRTLIFYKSTCYTHFEHSPHCKDNINFRIFFKFAMKRERMTFQSSFPKPHRYCLDSQEHRLPRPITLGSLNPPNLAHVCHPVCEAYRHKVQQYLSNRFRREFRAVP